MKNNTEKRQIKVTLVMALTADGLIARNSDEFVSWSGREDKRLFADISRKAGVIIMGKNTFNTFDGTLPDRLNVVMTSGVTEVSEDNLLFFSGSPEELLSRLEKMGFKEAVLAGGSYTNFTFCEKNLIDYAVLTISPVMFGRGLSLFGKPVDIDLDLLDFRKIDDKTLMLKYSFKKEDR